MAKTLKTIISLMMTLAMLLVSVPVMSAVAETDSASLIVEDINCYSKEEAEGKSIFVGEHYAASDGSVACNNFLADGASGSWSSANGKGRRFTLHDTGYDDGTDKAVQHAITYRPMAAGEKTVTRVNSSGVTLEADAYVERYAGDTWGFNGFMYTKKATVGDKLLKDVSAAEGGYAVYTIEVLDNASIDDAYLAVTYVDLDDSWIRSDNSHRGEIVVGVPLADYYDASKMGKQTVVVPLSAYDFKDNDVFVDCMTSNGQRLDYDLFDNYDNYRATKAVQWDGFTGMGIARHDTDAANVEAFQYVAYNLAIVGGYDAPVLAVDAATSTLSWTASGYADTTYTITKGDGTTIDAGAATSYVDSTMADGDIYTVTANVSVTSVAANAEVYVIPSTSEPVVAVAGGVVEKEDPSALLIADIDTTNGGDARATNIFVGDHYAQGDSTVHGLTFLNQGSNGSHYGANGKDGRNFYIHDTGYDDGLDSTPKGRAITYRPSAAGEYYVTRQSLSLYTADAYVERYVGGTWGFQGYVYSENAAEKKCKDLSTIANDGYAVFSIDVKSGSSVEDAYLAITYGDADAGWWSNSMSAYRGQIVVGVPLADYYDTAKMGKQTIYVPLSAFDLKDERVFVDIATMNSQTSTFTHGLFTDKANWRAANDVQWDTVTGIGWARNDTDGDNADFFTVIAHNVAFVDGYTAPVVTINEETSTISWNDVAYEGVTYTIKKR